MDLASSPATTAPTTTPGLLPAVAGPLDDPGAAACRQLPFPRFAAATSPRWSSAPPAPATGTGRAVTASSMAAHAAPQGAEPVEVAVVEEDKMDLLWEDFNEELVAVPLRRARRGGSWRDDGRRLVEEGEAPWSESSDAESEPAGRGCAPVLRPSARTGAGHCRRRAGTWVLLMRIFRRLFVVEKTIATQAARRGQGTMSR